MQKPEVAPLLSRKPCPAIVTFRPQREGGRFAGDEGERIRVLQDAVALGADYVDVELDSVAKLRRAPRTKLIVSVHDFEKTPGDLDAICSRIVATNPDVVKIATTARDVTDNLRIFELLRGAKLPTIALAMGERGVISRILAPKFGSYLTFATLDAANASAPGQLTVGDLLKVYRCRSIGRDTALFGVVANPVAHSMSPLIHNAAFAELGLDCVYLPFLVDDPDGFFREFRRLPVKGYSVTLPHKEAAWRIADEMDALTRRIGACNTLVEQGGKLIGTNTDCAAAVGAIGAAMGGKSPLSGKRIALVGARGTARAIGFGLVEAGARVKIFNRTVEKARELAEALGCEWAGLDELAKASADVVVNTTSVGMWPRVDESVVPVELLQKGTVVFDAVYNPVETRLLREARERGCVVISGLEMFVGQAARQFELFTGRTAPVETMRRVVEEKLSLPSR
jgi:3-dehydroquinate dehydratase/shikimate dehydrogenase